MGYDKLSIHTKLSKSVLFISLFFLLFSAVNVKGQDLAEGESLFKQNCTSCHKIGGSLIGPNLVGVRSRWSDSTLLIKFIKASQAVIKSGDKYSVELFKKYNQTLMPNHNFTDAQVGSILAYIDQEAVNLSKPKEATASAEGGTAASEDGGIGSLAIWGLILLIVILIIIISLLNKVISTLERLIMQKNGIKVEEEAEKESFAGLKRFAANRKAVALSAIALFIILNVYGWYTLKGVGIETGYQPKQPIAFPHDTHAGTYKIDCQYCHSGAAKSKNASIPSANVCMNCHNYVKPESPEIQKIYKALDYNAETRQYGPNQKPIEWVRIHNLPDFAYFNHSQHVTVAGVECQKCHGPVETMKEVYQYSELTMGWCINCHKETEVNFKGNAYYDRIIAAHDEIKAGKKVTVDMLGGTECAKCHY